MLLPPRALAERWGLSPQTILHIGAHEGEELALYDEAGWGKHRVVWVEALPDLAEDLKRRLAARREQVVICAVAWDKRERLNFYRTNNGQSSSALSLKEHRRAYPSIVEVESLDVDGVPLADALLDDPILMEPIGLINLDIQGAELRALIGLRDSLSNAAAVYSEVNVVELYTGCATLQLLNRFLAARNFRLVDLKITDEGWGDALWLAGISGSVWSRAWSASLLAYGSTMGRQRWRLMQVRRALLNFRRATAKMLRRLLRGARSRARHLVLALMPATSLRRVQKRLRATLGRFLPTYPHFKSEQKSQEAPENPWYYALQDSCQIAGLNHLLEKFLGQKSSGQYVEVGAYDGLVASNTWGLAERGWSGLLIEPVPGLAEQCRANYRSMSNVSVLEGAIGSHSGRLDINLAGVLSTANSRLLEEYQHVDWAKDSVSAHRISVPCFTLDEVLLRFGVAEGFDVLVVDVEGYESEVFSGFDLERWIPKMLIIELCETHPDLAVTAASDAILGQSIINIGYSVVYKDAINTVFVRMDVWQDAFGI